MIRILHGGQTGVDRGAHLGALDAGLEVGGYMPKNANDELGVIPIEVAKHLHRCTHSGYAARTEVNVEIAHAVLVVVASKHRPDLSPGTSLTISAAKARHRPVYVADSVADLPDVMSWMRRVSRSRSNELKLDTPDGRLNLLVAGPRASRWTNGESTARGLVGMIGHIT